MLSESVANGLSYYGQSSTTETEKFVRIFDKFFDCVNVRAIGEVATKRKPNQEVYKSPDDIRLKVLTIA